MNELLGSKMASRLSLCTRSLEVCTAGDAAGKYMIVDAVQYLCARDRWEEGESGYALTAKTWQGL